MSGVPDNPFLEGPLGPIYARTALPIIFVMAMNGLLTVVDALFLGHYVGPSALAAVTLMFPMYMLIVSLATLVAGGMSSLLARHLGGRRYETARNVFAGAHGLALSVAAGLIILFHAAGRPTALLAAGGDAELAAMGLTYLRITVLFSPMMFVLSVNSDALRNEGRVGFMAASSLLVSLSNIAFDYLLIAGLEMGVAGSAYASVLAQLLALTIIATFRFRGQTPLHPGVLLTRGIRSNWGSILALGAPQSLNFIGLALGSASVLAALQLARAPGFETTMSAYGIVTRVLTFGFLPLLGMSHAMQTITGNNFGSAQWHRADASLRVALFAALAYCAVIQAVLTAFAAPIGAAFVSDPAVVSEVARIMPIIVALLALMGPLMMISSYFQAIGDARRAAVLGLSKPYLFAIPLTFALGQSMGEPGIWIAGPVAEAMLLVLTLAVLTQRARRSRNRWGLFSAP